MLVTAEELRFDLRGKVFDLTAPRDRAWLRWVFSQFLYGEVTGIQCGHWLYRAPHLNAATFLARQASEELSHVRKFLRIFTLLGEKPEPAHWAIRFLSTGMMGADWGEHVALEMALGEGLVLGAFYALVDAIEDPEIRKILQTAAAEEERHVEFGERETQEWLHAHPKSRSRLLGQALVQAWALRRLKGFVARGLAREGLAGHAVLGRFEEFFEHGIGCFERRVERLRLSPVPLRELSFLARVRLMAALPFRKFFSRMRPRPRRLTEIYLTDPAVQREGVQQERERLP